MKKKKKRKNAKTEALRHVRLHEIPDVIHGFIRNKRILIVLSMHYADQLSYKEESGLGSRLTQMMSSLATSPVMYTGLLTSTVLQK